MIVNAELLKQRSKEKSYTSDKDDIKSNDGSKRQSLSSKTTTNFLYFFFLNHIIIKLFKGDANIWI
jgi:hypothetical protein